MKLKVCQYFAADAWLKFLSLILVLGLVKILKLEFNQNVDVWLRF